LPGLPNAGRPAGVGWFVPGLPSAFSRLARLPLLRPLAAAAPSVRHSSGLEMQGLQALAAAI
jgi:hypothetical protein